jgi:hypothetical protein
MHVSRLLARALGHLRSRLLDSADSRVTVDVRDVPAGVA